MKESRILRYWEAFQKVSGVTGEHYLAEQFGYGKQVGDESAEWSPVNKIDNLNRDFFVLCYD